MMFSCTSRAKTIKKNTNSTQNKSETHHAKQYEVTSFLSTNCELSTETCSKNVYSLGPSFRPCDERKALHELQHCLDEVDSWLRQNRLLLNGIKTKMITFGTKQRLPVATNIHVTVDGCLISPGATTKNFGIVYDSTLSMEHQVHAVLL